MRSPSTVGVDPPTWLNRVHVRRQNQRSASAVVGDHVAVAVALYAQAQGLESADQLNCNGLLFARRTVDSRQVAEGLDQPIPIYHKTRPLSVRSLPAPLTKILADRRSCPMDSIVLAAICRVKTPPWTLGRRDSRGVHYCKPDLGARDGSRVRTAIRHDDPRPARGRETQGASTEPGAPPPEQPGADRDPAQGRLQGRERAEPGHTLDRHVSEDWPGCPGRRTRRCAACTASATPRRVSS